MSKSEQIRKKNYAGRGPFLVPPKSCKDPDLVDLSKVFENHPKYNEDLLNEFETLGARVVITAYYDDIISGNGVDKEVYEATLLNSTPAEKCFKDFCSAISSIGDTNILKAQAIYIRLTQCKSVEAIAPDLPKSPTQTNRYLREMYKKMRTDEFKQSLRE